MRKLANLQNQLQAYSVAAKSIQFNPSSKNWKGQWSVYAAAAGSALALATNANAGIIYSGIQNKSASVAPTSSGHNTNTANFAVGGAPFALRAFNWVSSSWFTSANAILKMGGGSHAQRVMALPPIGTQLQYARRLSSGAVISLGQAFDAVDVMLHRRGSSGADGEFLNSVVGFAGIGFTQGGQNHFGWIRLHVGEGANFAESVTAIDWAYNDVANASIRAGQTSDPVPEPSTVSMALLAAGAAGVLAWKRRRKPLAT